MDHAVLEARSGLGSALRQSCRRLDSSIDRRTSNPDDWGQCMCHCDFADRHHAVATPQVTSNRGRTAHVRSFASLRMTIHAHMGCAMSSSSRARTCYNCGVEYSLTPKISRLMILLLLPGEAYVLHKLRSACTRWSTFL